MSNNVQRTIEIIFQGTDQMGDTFGQIGSNLDSMESAVRSVTGPLSDLADDILKVQTAVAVLGTAGIAYAVNEFRNLEDVMLKVKGVMGASEDEYDALIGLTKELGTTTRFTATEAAEGLEFLALAGMSFEEAMSALPTTLQMAQAAGIELSATADIVTNIMAGYGVAADQIDVVSDTLVAAFTNSNTSLEQLGEAFKMVGPVAATTGLTLDETAAILGKLADAGYQGTMGGTSLRNILLELANPTTNARDLFNELGISAESLGLHIDSSTTVMEALGVSTKTASGDLRPFTDIMAELEVGLDKIPGSADQAAIMIELFGRRGGPQMAALLTAGSDSIIELQETIEGLGGVTERIAEEMESGIGGALRGFRSAFSGLATEIGEAASGEIEPAIRSFTGLFQAAAVEVEKGSFEPIFDKLGEFATRFASNIDGVAGALPEALDGLDWTRLLDGLDELDAELGRLFRTLFNDLDPTNPEELAKILQTIVDSLGNLAASSAGVVSAWNPLISLVSDLIQRFSEADTETVKLGGEIAGTAQAAEFLFDRFGYLKGGLILAAAEFSATGESANTMGKVFSGLMVGGNLLVSSAVFGLVGKLLEAKTAMTGLGTAATALGAAGKVGASFAGGWVVGTAINEGIDKLVQHVSGSDSLGGLVYEWIHGDGQAEGAMDDLNRVLDPSNLDMSALEAAQNGFQDFGKTLDEWQFDVPPLEIDASQLEAARDIVSDLGWDLDDLTDERIMEIAAQFDGDGLAAELDETAEDRTVIYLPDVDEPAAQKAQEVLEAISPEVQLEMDTREFEAQMSALETYIEAESETVQTAIEWEAKMDIAMVEANAKKVVAIMGGVEATMNSTADVIGTLFTAMGDISPYQYDEIQAIERQIQAEFNMRQEAHDLTMEMGRAELDLMEARASRLEAGEPLITVSGDGLQPHLESFMWEILGSIQTRVTEEGLDMLTGA